MRRLPFRKVTSLCATSVGRAACRGHGLAVLALALTLQTLAGCGTNDTSPVVLADGGVLDGVALDGGLDVQLDALPDGLVPDVMLPDTADVATGTDAEQPSTDAEQPGTDTAQPGTDAEQPGTDAAQPGTDAEAPGSDAESPKDDTGSFPDDTGSFPDDTGSFPDDTGSFPDDTGSFPDDTGSFPDDTGSFPDDTGSLPDDTGSLPDDTGSFPGDTGSLPDDTGSLPDDTGSLPDDTEAPGSDAQAADVGAEVWSCVVVALVDANGNPLTTGSVTWTELGAAPTTTAAEAGAVCRPVLAGTSLLVAASAPNLVATPQEQSVQAPASAASCGAADACQKITITLAPPPECDEDGDCDDANACTSNFCSDGTCAFGANDGVSCTDGDACTSGDVCAFGVCKSGTLANCDDDEVCTADTCATDTGLCVHTAVSGPCSDGSLCTPDDTCVEGQCVPGTPPVCQDNNACTSDSCDPASGNCQFVPVVGSPTCNDNNPCTADETCSDGLCGNGTAKNCDDTNPCTIDSCDTLTGTCTSVAGPDNEPCTDGDACTQQDACVAGSCVGSNPVVCVAKDTCHSAGSCDSATGVCSDPQKDDGTACNDFNACTKVDTCSAGQCLGSDPVVCAAPETCRSAGICNTNSGQCFYGNLPTGTACSDGNACTENETCTNGVCLGGSAVNCDDGKDCTNDSCNNTVGCLHLYNTLPCDDGNPCTTGDACATGVCQAGAPDPCNDSNPCTADSCDAALGCVHTPTLAPCTDGNACTQIDKCDGGVCVGSNPVVCTAQDQCHEAGVCDSASGVCSNPNKPNGSACNDGSACTQTDTCQAGACTGSNPVVCTALSACHDVGTCNAQTGVCSNPAKPGGAACDDANPCTQFDSCQTGICVGGPPKVCTALDQCHNPGTCDTQTGACSNPTKLDGSTCNDGSACTQTDACTSGTCVGSNPVVCTAMDQCHTAGTCNPQTGTCNNPNKPDASPCNDGNACTNTDVCAGGVCAGQAVVCTALDDCHAPGSCDPVSGDCSNPDQDPSAYDDQVACTIDACSGGSITHTPDNSQCSLLQQCTPTGCQAIAENGQVIVSEFQALGSEFVELHNTTALPIDVRGWTLRNGQGESATLRASDDPLGLVGTPVSIPAGGRLYGIANPGSPLGGGVGFFWGPPASGFDLADSGDVLILESSTGNTIHDYVDFRTLVSNPNTALTASSFVASSTASAQLEPTKLSATGNNSPLNWCTTFFAAGGSAKVSHTAGAANGSCQRVVINEVVIDPPSADDQKAWVELAGPGGALVAGYRIADMEGKSTSAGTLNTDGETNSGAVDGEFVIPAGVRIPADGYLLIADADATVTTTQVPGYLSGVDVLAKDIDMENSGGDAIQLIRPDGTLADVLGHETVGNNLDVTNAANGLAIYEKNTAITAPTGSVGISFALARLPTSDDTDNNRSDFHGDPTPTPGVANDALNFTITSVVPDDGLAGYGAKDITVTGTDLASDLKIKAGVLADATCTLVSTTQATCTLSAYTGSLHGRVDLRFTPHASLGVQPITLTEGFTYTRPLFGGSLAEEADFRQLVSPLTLSAVAGTESPLVYCRMYEPGETEADGAPAGWIAEVGYGIGASAHPTASNVWRFFPMSYNAQVGNNDEFAGSFTIPAGVAGTVFRYTCRFSKDGGISWSYADTTGVLASDSLTFSAADQGTLTLAAP